MNGEWIMDQDSPKRTPPLDIRNSKGIQIGDGAVQYNRFILKVGRAVAATIALLSVAISIYTVVQIRSNVPHSNLKLVAFSVDQPSELDGEAFQSGAEGDRVPFAVDATAIDITLRNDGTAPAVIIQLVIRVEYAKQLEDCSESGGGVYVSAEYSVPIPHQVPPSPFTVTQDVRFEVKPGTLDRFTISLGPDTQYTSNWVPWIYVADVNLVQDASKPLIHAGSAAIVAQSGDGIENLEHSNPDNPSCIERNGEKVIGASPFQAVRSDELSQLKAKFDGILMPNDPPSREVCTSGASLGQESGTIDACFTYSRLRLSATFRLPATPTVDLTQIVVRIAVTDDTTKHYLLVALYSQLYRGLGWSVSCLEGNGDGRPGSACVNSDESSTSLNVTVPVSPHFDHKSIDVVVQLREAAPGTTGRTLLQAPGTGHLEVPRGVA
jgi:hypothetical protein